MHFVSDSIWGQLLFGRWGGGPLQQTCVSCRAPHECTDQEIHSYEPCVLALECFTTRGFGTQYLKENQINHVLTALQNITLGPINSCDAGTQCERLELTETSRRCTVFTTGIKTRFALITK